jgi:hypothetical protein
MDIFHFYMNFPESIDNHVHSIDQSSVFIKMLQVSIDRADCENGSKIYYNGTNKDKFVEDAKTLQEFGFFGTLDIEDVINYLLIDSDSSNWESDPIFIDNEFYCKYKHILESGDHAENTELVLKELAEKSNLVNDSLIEKCLLINFCETPTIKNTVNVLRVHKQHGMSICLFDSVNNFSQLDEWINNTRRVKVYNLTDNRHIENHPEYIKGKSPNLYGMANRPKAAELLTKSIGDKRFSNYTLNLDQDKECYIRFEFENHHNQYHGYHMVEPITHEINDVRIKQLPPRVLDILNYRNIK